MNDNTTAVATVRNTAGSVYCSVQAKTLAEKKKLFNALEQCDALLNDCVDQVIAIKDVYIEAYDKEDDITGEVRTGHRTIIFGTDGKSYVTGSNYFCNKLTKILTVFGTPDTWSEPLKVKIIKTPVKGGNPALTLTIVEDDAE